MEMQRAPPARAAVNQNRWAVLCHGRLMTLLQALQYPVALHHLPLHAY